VETQTEAEEEEEVQPLLEEVRFTRTTTQVQVMKKLTNSNKSWSTADNTTIQVTPMTIQIAMQHHSLLAKEARPLDDRRP
jgi:hypothetical protein